MSRPTYVCSSVLSWLLCELTGRYNIRGQGCQITTKDPVLYAMYNIYYVCTCTYMHAYLTYVCAYVHVLLQYVHTYVLSNPL